MNVRMNVVCMSAKIVIGNYVQNACLCLFEATLLLQMFHGFAWNKALVSTLKLVVHEEELMW
jgi:hypothetical protein